MRRGLTAPGLVKFENSLDALCVLNSELQSIFFSKIKPFILWQNERELNQRQEDFCFVVLLFFETGFLCISLVIDQASLGLPVLPLPPYSGIIATHHHPARGRRSLRDFVHYRSKSVPPYTMLRSQYLKEGREKTSIQNAAFGHKGIGKNWVSPFPPIGFG